MNKSSIEKAGGETVKGDPRPRYELVPVNLDEANAFVSENHRHLGPVVGAKFAVAAGILRPLFVSLGVVGVAIVGRPVARSLDDGWTLEVNRLATYPEHDNAGSFLYGACRRATFALGYRRLITYNLASESGASLRAAGFRVIAERKPRHGWDTPSRPRVNEYRKDERRLWEDTLQEIGS